MYEMNEGQVLLFNVLTSLQKEISLSVISGKSDIDAYRESSGKAIKEGTMRASVSEILANPNVKLFMDSMINTIVNPAIMSREEMMKELTLVARTNANDLIEWGYRDVEAVNKETGEAESVPQSFWTLKNSDEINPDHMGSIEEVTAGKEGLKFKRTPKLTAMKQLAELAGYDAPSKSESKIIEDTGENEW